MNKVVGRAKGELQDKRFHIPGVKIKTKCPKCGTPQQKDLSQEYFSYPQINKFQDFHFECDEYMDEEDGGIKATGLQGQDIYLCGEAWTVKAKFDISVTVK